MVIFIAQLIFLSIAAYLRPTEIDRLYFKTTKTEDHTHMGPPADKHKFGPRADDWIRLVCEAATYIFCIQFVYQQLKEIKVQGLSSYGKNMV